MTAGGVTGRIQHLHSDLACIEVLSVKQRQVVALSVILHYNIFCDSRKTAGYNPGPIICCGNLDEALSHTINLSSAMSSRRIQGKLDTSKQTACGLVCGVREKNLASKNQFALTCTNTSVLEIGI